MKITKASPIYYVEAIEPLLDFWASLGFEKTVGVQHGNGLGFVILVNGEREVMLQTHASLADDLPEGAKLAPKFSLYFDVDAVAEAAKTVKGAKILVEERTTPYGARECWVLDPAGHLVGFAQPK